MSDDAYTMSESNEEKYVQAYAVDAEVEHPQHYTSDKSGVECITITRHRNFNVGNAIKYLWRAGLKDDGYLQNKEKHTQDLKKAIFYINDEIDRISYSDDH